MSSNAARREFRDEHGITPRQLGRDLAIAALALVSVGIGVYELTHPTLPDQGLTFLDGVDLVIVGVFVVDFVWQGSRSRDWGAYLRRHWWEVPSLLPASGFLFTRIPGVSLVRAVRLLRLIRVLRLVRVVGMAHRVQADARYALRVLHRAHVPTLLFAAFFIVGLGSVAAFLVESDVNARFRSGGMAFWWALNMVTNVAYVDFQPMTTAGRVLAGVLELSGIAFIGVFTASLANAIVKEPTPDEEDAAAEGSPE